ncbi:MAG: zinc ribbon domain-containing protein [Thermoplasmata archaeon]
MADGDSNKCGLCGAELGSSSDVCPNCGADLSLLDLEEGEGLDAIKQSTSLDDLLATVLDNPEMATSKKKEGGKSFDDLDLDLEIPDEPVEKPRLDLDVLEEEPAPPAEAVGEAPPQAEVPPEDEALPEVPTVPEEEVVTYECPECGARVAENASLCVSCGALFSEETLACPECNAEVPTGSPRCPQCGVQFLPETEAGPSFAAETVAPWPTAGSGTRLAPTGSGHLVKSILDRYETLEQQPLLPSRDATALQRSLKEYVTYLRSLLILAKAVRVPTDSIQIKVADATRRARAGDLEGAVRMAHSAKLALEQSLALQVAKRLEMLQAELEENRTRGTPFPVAESLVKRAVVSLESGRVQSAYEGLERAREDVAASSGGQTDARYAIQTAKEMVDEVTPLGLRTGELETSLAQGEAALRHGNWERAAQTASSVQERVTETLQAGLLGEMKRIREKVMQLKIQGKDISRPIALLKQAGASIKEKSYEDAMRYLDLIKQDIRM